MVSGGAGRQMGCGGGDDMDNFFKVLLGGNLVMVRFDATQI